MFASRIPFRCFSQFYRTTVFIGKHAEFILNENEIDQTGKLNGNRENNYKKRD